MSQDPNLPKPSAHASLIASSWVQRWAHLVPQNARILDVACGSGRHMAFFQQKGHVVTGVDRDPLALTSCKPYGRTLLADIENDSWPLPNEVFDAVVVTHYLWRPLFPALLGAIKPGGLLIYETFAHGNETVGRPARPQFLLQRGELLRVCEGFEVIAYENGYLDHPERFIQRICASKPDERSGASLQKRLLLSLECRHTSI